MQLAAAGESELPFEKVQQQLGLNPDEVEPFVFEGK